MDALELGLKGSQKISYAKTTSKSINFRGLKIGRTRTKMKHQDKSSSTNANTQSHGRLLRTRILSSTALLLCHWEVELRENLTRQDMSYTVHQLALSSTKHKQSHEQVMKYLGRYLLGTQNKGLILQPKRPTNLQCYVDADFAGDWDTKEFISDTETAKSQTGFIVLLAGVPLY
jgi:hypothetical protein